MKAIIETNYAVTKARGLITEDTTSEDLIMKLEEEVQELIDAERSSQGDTPHELADIILVCLNMARHWAIDVEAQLIKNITNNIQR